jgi:pheromone a factor receptor
MHSGGQRLNYYAASRITVAAAVGIPVTSMCIHRRLYHIASVKTVRITSDQKKRAVIVDLAIGLGIPLLEVCLCMSHPLRSMAFLTSTPVDTIVQNSRFVVYERVGCLPTVYVTPASVVLTWIWPIVIGAISCVYCGQLNFESR